MPGSCSAQMAIPPHRINIRRDTTAGRAGLTRSFRAGSCGSRVRKSFQVARFVALASSHGQHVWRISGVRRRADTRCTNHRRSIPRSRADPFAYGSLTITDGVFTSVHAPTTITISRTLWHDAPALLAVRDGPLITRVSLDSITVSLASLAPLHWASWYPTQHPVGSMHADFDSSMVTIVMTGRYDTVATFPYRATDGQLPFGWTQSLVVPALPLTNGWHGTLQIALPIHPHAYKLLGRPWETMSLRVIGREKLRVAAGDFDCWKVQVGEPEDRSHMWVSTLRHTRGSLANHLSAGDSTRFEDRAWICSV